jgi:hypothetical protein
MSGESQRTRSEGVSGESQRTTGSEGVSAEEAVEEPHHVEEEEAVLYQTPAPLSVRRLYALGSGPTDPYEVLISEALHLPYL